MKFRRFFCVFACKAFWIYIISVLPVFANSASLVSNKFLEFLLRPNQFFIICRSAPVVEKLLQSSALRHLQVQILPSNRTMQLEGMEGYDFSGTMQIQPTPVLSDFGFCETNYEKKRIHLDKMDSQSVNKSSKFLEEEHDELENIMQKNRAVNPFGLVLKTHSGKGELGKQPIGKFHDCNRHTQTEMYFFAPLDKESTSTIMDNFTISSFFYPRSKVHFLCPVDTMNSIGNWCGSRDDVIGEHQHCELTAELSSHMCNITDQDTLFETQKPIQNISQNTKVVPQSTFMMYKWGIVRNKYWTSNFDPFQRFKRPFRRLEIRLRTYSGNTLIKVETKKALHSKTQLRPLNIFIQLRFLARSTLEFTLADPLLMRMAMLLCVLQFTRAIVYVLKSKQKTHRRANLHQIYICYSEAIVQNLENENLEKYIDTAERTLDSIEREIRRQSEIELSVSQLAQQSFSLRDAHQLQNTSVITYANLIANERSQAQKIYDLETERLDRQSKELEVLIAERDSLRAIADLLDSQLRNFRQIENSTAAELSEIEGLTNPETKCCESQATIDYLRNENQALKDEVIVYRFSLQHFVDSSGDISIGCLKNLEEELCWQKLTEDLEIHLTKNTADQVKSCRLESLHLEFSLSNAEFDRAVTLKELMELTELLQNGAMKLVIDKNLEAETWRLEAENDKLGLKISKCYKNCHRKRLKINILTRLDYDIEKKIKKRERIKSRYLNK